MSNDLSTRVQNIMSNIEQLKVKKIEYETNAKRYSQEIDECKNSLKELGYDSVESATLAAQDLEKAILEECSDLESKISLLNI